MEIDKIMERTELPATIQWRIHLSSPPEKVFNTLVTDDGRRSFWAVEAPEEKGTIYFRFVNGMVYESRIFEKREPTLFTIEYFGGSRVQFELTGDDVGGTDLTLTETDLPEANRLIHLTGWIPVLLALKAAVDFSVDLRNHDPTRSWDHGYVDV
jgi:uncharacterized protein YndB with AHSA1/START domain